VAVRGNPRRPTGGGDLKGDQGSPGLATRPPPLFAGPMTLRVTQYGEEVLRQPGRRVEVFDGALRELAQSMRATMRAEEGIGLAAQQVGEALHFCVVDLGPAAREEGEVEMDGRPVPASLLQPLYLANATVEPEPAGEIAAEEGCLSFPGVRGEVPRPPRIRVSYRDLDGAAHTLRCAGLLARCIQHEVDHCNGVLFIDRMDPAERTALRPALRKLEKKARRSALREPSA